MIVVYARRHLVGGRMAGPEQMVPMGGNNGHDFEGMAAKGLRLSMVEGSSMFGIETACACKTCGRGSRG